MKREPNPYSKNPRLTVTSTMSISVPSMVAEDVLDGTDAPVITVDPNVNDRIDTISGAVELLDTRIDAVSNMSELLYGSCISAISTVSGAVELMDTRIDAVSEVLALNDSGSSSGSSNVELTDDLKKLNFEGDRNNKVIYFSGNFNGESTELQYYALAAGAFANAEYPKSQLKVNHSGLLYTTVDGGNTWTLVGSNNSLSENCVTFADDNNLGEVVVRKEYDSLSFMARTTDKSALAYYSLYAPHFYCGDSGEFEFRVADVSNGSNILGLQMRKHSGDWVTITGDNSSSSGSSDSGLEVNSYLAGLDPTLEFYANGNYVNLSNVVEGNTGIGLILKNSPGGYTNAVYPIYTPGLINPQNKDYRLAWLAHNSGEFELKQTTDGGNTWTSLSGGSSSGNSSTNLFYWNYAGNEGESSAMASLVFGELDSPYVFIDNPIAIQGGDNSRLGIRPVNVSGQLSWEACDSYGNWAPISSSTGADDYLTVHGESLEAKYVRATSGKVYSGDNIKTYRLSPKNDTAVIYALQTFLAASGLHGQVDYLSGEAARTVMTLVEGVTQASTPSILWTTDDGKGFRKWEPWKEDGSSSGSSSDSTDSKLEIKSKENEHFDKKTFIVEISKTYRDPVMSLQLYSSESNTSQLYAVAAPWFASSDSSNYGMRIVPDSDLSNMLELTTNGGASWNKLPWPTISGGSSGSAAGVYELGLLDNGSDSGSRMLPLISSPNLTSGVNVELLSWAIGSSTSDAQDTSGMYTLVGNPIALYDSAYRAPNDSRIKGAVRVVDMHGKICWQRYSYTQKQWLIESGDGSSSSGSAAGVYELGLLDNGNDSGSHMMPLVAETSTSLGGGSRSLAAVRWSIGASTTESNDLSGVYTLMANPLALFGYHHDSIDDIHITGAIRPMWTSAGNLAWQKLDYSTKQWKPINAEAASDKIKMTEVYEGIFDVKAEAYDSYQGKNILTEVKALTSGLGTVFNNTSIVACLKANTATNLRTSGIGIHKTAWKEQYTSFWGGECDITELVIRAHQVCEIAGHLSQIRWLCENTASISALINK